MANAGHFARFLELRVNPYFRKRRLGPLVEMIQASIARSGRAHVIDVGGTSEFWQVAPADLLTSSALQITIVNLPGVELPRREGRFVYEDADGCDLGRYRDGQFDIAFSNSVIEHVGSWSSMRRFANEVRRVAKTYFVQTPNFWFPVEPHCMTPFFHWLPFATRVWLLLHFDCGHWRGRRTVDAAVSTAESAKLLNAKMMRELFPEAELHKERLLFLPKSLMAIKR